MARHIPYEENHKTTEDGELLKKCSIHDIYSPEDENSWFPCTEEYFYKAKTNSIDGLSPWCKKCSSRKSRKRIVENFEEYQKYKKQFDIDNKEWHREYYKEYLEENKDSQYEARDNWQKSEYGREWCREYNKNRNKIHKISKKQWVVCKEYFENACAYCGLPKEKHFVKRKGKMINQDLHKEHVDPYGNNELGNCVPGCQKCNSEKHTFSLDEWYNKSNPNYTQERYDKIIKWIIEDHKQFLNLKRNKKSK